MAQKQKLAAERENLQAELEHFKKCLTLPQSPWSRAHFKGYPPRWHPSTPPTTHLDHPPHPSQSPKPRLVLRPLGEPEERWWGTEDLAHNLPFTDLPSDIILWAKSPMNTRHGLRMHLVHRECHTAHWERSTPVETQPSLSHGGHA